MKRSTANSAYKWLFIYRAPFVVQEKLTKSVPVVRITKQGSHSLLILLCHVVTQTIVFSSFLHRLKVIDIPPAHLMLVQIKMMPPIMGIPTHLNHILTKILYCRLRRLLLVQITLNPVGLILIRPSRAWIKGIELMLIHLRLQLMAILIPHTFAKTLVPLP